MQQSRTIPRPGMRERKWIVNLKGPLRPRAGKPAAGEKNGCAAFRQGIIGVVFRRSPAFHNPGAFYARERGRSPWPPPPGASPETALGDQIHRADGPAQPAKTAFKGQGQGGVVLEIDPVGDFFRIAVSCQKSALPTANGAFDALFSTIFRQIDQVASHFLPGR